MGDSKKGRERNEERYKVREGDSERKKRGVRKKKIKR